MRQVGVECPDCGRGYNLYDTDLISGWDCKCGHIFKDENGLIAEWIDGLKTTKHILTQLINDIEEDPHWFRCIEASEEHDHLSEARAIVKRTIEEYKR